MTVTGIDIVEDGGALVVEAHGQIVETASPYTFRLRFQGDVKKYLVGFFDTLAHAIAALAAANTAAQFTGANVTPQTVQTWMTTTSPQAGFVTTRTTTGGNAITTDLYVV